MDPDETLQDIRDLIAGSEESTDASDFGLLMELVEGLDTWLTSGGFLPADWQKGR